VEQRRRVFAAARALELPNPVSLPFMLMREHDRPAWVYTGPLEESQALYTGTVSVIAGASLGAASRGSCRRVRVRAT